MLSTLDGSNALTKQIPVSSFNEVALPRPYMVELP
jgi:hypothetical protein